MVQRVSSLWIALPTTSATLRWGFKGKGRCILTSMINTSDTCGVEEHHLTLNSESLLLQEIELCKLDSHCKFPDSLDYLGYEYMQSKQNKKITIRI